ncbi:YrhK family protein [Gordonia sp. PKS22-38]|uniref:YrhK family protein n=1 Tax=Gordonia prachuapensis TaxID=3115651 RepID=A0ABU7MT52_9ACTN|nr:YrhK family protein [Gordonia sp. PKS22-38]
MSDDDITIRIGRDELMIRQRWETASIANDVLIAMWFVAGSICFFWESTTVIATWLFLIGSIEFLVRPAIRLARRVQIRQVRPVATGSDSAFDY